MAATTQVRLLVRTSLKTHGMLTLGTQATADYNVPAFTSGPFTRKRKLQLAKRAVEAQPFLEAGCFLIFQHAFKSSSSQLESNAIQFRRKTTPKGFEPLRAEPNGFLVHLLSHSDTVSSARPCTRSLYCFRLVLLHPSSQPFAAKRHHDSSEACPTRNVEIYSKHGHEA